VRTLVVVNNEKDWPLDLPGVEVIDVRSYLTGPEFATGRATTVFNLCRSYRYQSMGYYVSLLAAARGHRPIPSIGTIRDLVSSDGARYASDELDELIQKSLQPLQSDSFVLSIYFGCNVAKRYDRLSRHLFSLFEAPLLRAQFERNSKWELRKIAAIGARDIPPEHMSFVVSAAEAYFERPRYVSRKPRTSRYDMAILCNPEEAMPPSNERALAKFQKAARKVGIETERITREDYGRLAEFDALLIRETTSVNHHTYRFARRAQNLGLVVIDDPESILKCTNKVYLAERLMRQQVRVPKTFIAHRDNLGSVSEAVGLPCILKQPDSYFSQGVFKADSEESLREGALRLLAKSDLIIAQEFFPTDFDWRVGVLDGQPLYVCRYYMAPRHWQIQKTESSGKVSYGRCDTLPVEDAPHAVVKTALKAANLVGNGLYGVDLKERDRRVYVIEVNDNPSIDSGIEDDVLKDGLYDTIMNVFVQRIEKLKQESVTP